MKTLVPIEWANQIFYNAGADAWRNGSTPTKAVPPASFAAEGLVPGDRYAAEWENYYRYTNTQNIKDLAVEQISFYNRTIAAPASFGSDTTMAMAWNPYLKAFVRVSAGTVGTRVAICDALGFTHTRGDPVVVTSMPAISQDRCVFVDTGAPSTSFQIGCALGQNLATAGYSYAATALINDGSGMPVVTRPTPPGGHVMYSNMVDSGNGAALSVGCVTGPGAIVGLRCTASAWTVVTLPSAPTFDFTYGTLWVVPGASAGIFWIYYSRPDTSTLFIWKSTNYGGAYSLIYSGTSFFAGCAITSAPAWDSLTGLWYIITDQTTAYVVNSTTRFQTRVCTATDAQLAAGTATSTKTIQGLSVGNALHLGSGRFVGVCVRAGTQPSSASDRAIIGMCSSIDYGDSWTLSQFDIGLQTSLAIVAKPPIAAFANSNWSLAGPLLASGLNIAQNGAILGYTTSATSNMTYLGLNIAGGAQIKYT